MRSPYLMQFNIIKKKFNKIKQLFLFFIMPICSLAQLHKLSRYKSEERIGKHKQHILEYKMSLNKIQPIKLYTRNSYERKCLHDYAQELGLLHEKWVDNSTTISKIDTSQCIVNERSCWSDYYWTNINIQGPVRREPATFIKIWKKH